MIRHLLCLSILAAGGVFAQNLELGAIGGFGFTNDLTVKSPSGSATAGLATGGAFGAFFEEDSYKYIGGEVQYLYRYSDLRLSSGGTSVDFAAHTNIVDGGMVLHFRPRGAHIRPFIAAGAGVMVLTGTGAESASQPLGNFAALTATRQTLPVVDVGGGVKISLQRHMRLRFEVRDYISSSPSKVIAPVPGASVSGWLNDIMASASVSYTF